MACLSLRHETSPAASGQVFMPPPYIPAPRGPREERDQMYPYMLCETQALSWEKGDSQRSGAGVAQSKSILLAVSASSLHRCLCPLWEGGVSVSEVGQGLDS